MRPAGSVRLTRRTPLLQTVDIDPVHESNTSTVRVVTVLPSTVICDHTGYADCAMAKLVGLPSEIILRIDILVHLGTPAYR